MVSPVTVVSPSPLSLSIQTSLYRHDHFIKKLYQFNSSCHCIWIHKCVTIFISYSSIAWLRKPLLLLFFLYVVYMHDCFACLCVCVCMTVIFKLCLCDQRMWQCTYSTLTSLFGLNVCFCLCILGITMCTWLWPACSCLLYLYKPCAMLSWIVLVYLCSWSIIK